MAEKRTISDVIILDNLYPRSQMDTATIARYVDSIDSLPPIEINQNNVLIDGAHRLSAHKQAGLKEIDCIITQTSTDRELYELAIERNALHGLSLTSKEKKSIANQLYDGSNKAHLSKILGVPERTLARWLEGKDREFREQKDAMIFDMFMRCETQEEIAKQTSVDQSTVARSIEKIMQNCQMAEMHKTFKPELYSIWNFAKLEKEHDYAGNLPPAILENILWKYTKPFDVVFDPFGGAGYSIDICKAWSRRYFVTDINPSEIAQKRGVQKHDITTGLPDGLPTIDLAFLDPPYWNQMQGIYGDEATNLSNLPLDQFYQAMENIFKCLYKKVKENGTMCFIIQNTQWKNEDKHIEPHSHVMWNLAEKAGFKFDQLIQVPYSTQQYNAQQVEKAKEQKLWLVINRELIVFRKA